MNDLSDSDKKIMHEAIEVLDHLHESLRENSVNGVINGVGLFLAEIIGTLPKSGRKILFNHLILNLMKVLELDKDE